MKRLVVPFVVLVATAPALAGSADGPMSGFLDQNVLPWIAAPAVIAAVQAQNAAHGDLTQAEIDDMDKQWRGEIGAAATPLISSVTGNAVSAFLSEQVAGLGGQVTEVFVMDNRGLNVAASAMTSDYWQGDEAKFQATFEVGLDARHFSDVEKDESTGRYQGQASFTLVDPETGTPIGAVTVGIDAEALF